MTTIIKTFKNRKAFTDFFPARGLRDKKYERHHRSFDYGKLTLTIKNPQFPMSIRIHIDENDFNNNYCEIV